MKKILFSIIALLGVFNASAQTKWDFTQTPESDVSALKAATTEWTYTESSNRFESINAINGPLKAGNVELQLTKGLKFEAAAKKIRIDVNNRVQLAGKNIPVTTPALKKGQKVTIVFASTGTTAVTFDANTNLTDAQGFVAADKNTTQTGKATVAEDGPVSFKSTGGSINIFSIEVSEAPDDPVGPSDVINNNVARNPNVNQALLTLNNGDKLYYDTQSLQAIDIDDETGKVTLTTTGQQQDILNGSLANLTFAKKQNNGQNPVIDNGCVEVTEAQGWQESLYAKWKLTPGAKSYNVYVVGGQYANWTKVDEQLVRNYGTYGRVDVVGLSAGQYDLNVEPVWDASEGEELPPCIGSIVTGLTVKNYDRTGYAHFNYSGVGAYNDDGTLKAGAKVLYVTKNTAKTISTNVTGAEQNPCVGIQAIIDAYQKGKDTTPIAFRFIGLIEKDALDAISSSEEGLQVKGKKADSEMNITFEGIGDDATLRGFGFLVRNAKSVEFRNFAILRCMDDGISLDTDNSNIWVHNIDFFYGKHGSGDHDKGDGSCDAKSDTKYSTFSYCHYWDTGKTNMFGMKNESGPNYLSYHHNWFDHSDSRHPRVRTMTVHVYNNYFDNVAKYGVGATSGSSVFVENNYFLKTKKPILSSKQGTDAQGNGTFSGEDGGMIKAYGNYFDRTAANFKYYTQNDLNHKTDYDAYETATRDEQVPATEKALVGGTAYNNFDTDATKIYPYTPDAAEVVPAIVTGYYGAGRMNHGDFRYTFKDNVGSDDTDSAYDTVLGDKIDSYTSALVGFFGDENTQPGGGEQPGGDQPGGGDEPGGDDPAVNPTGTILCTFAKDGTPSSSFFTVIGNGSDSKGTVTVDGKELKTCLKMESSTSIKFTLTATMDMTLYFASTETASIKINGTKISGSGSTYTQQLKPGSYELTKDKSVNLFAIKLVPVE